MTSTGKLVTAVAGALAVVVVASVLWWANHDGSAKRGAVVAADARAAVGDNFNKNEPEFEASLKSFYNEFLNAGDARRTPADGENGSGLTDLATPAVVADYDTWRGANEAHGDSFQRVREIRSAPNIAGFTVDGPKLTIRDCTAETLVMTDKQEVTHYVTRFVDVANFGGLYRVTHVDVRHAGLIETPGYACIPDPMAKQATDTVAKVVREYSAAQADPRPGPPAGLKAVVAGPLEAKLASSLTQQAAKNISIAASTQVAPTTLGLDPRGVGVVAVVSACITYPTGIVQRELSTAKVQREVFPAGTQGEVTYTVRLNDDAGPVATSIVSEKLPTKC